MQRESLNGERTQSIKSAVHTNAQTNLLKTFDPHDVRVRRRKVLQEGTPQVPTDEGSKWQRQ
jgi:hypothetical protein